MATCADCVHVEACNGILNGFDIDIEFFGEQVSVCKNFKDRSQFMELPDVGDYDTVTTIDEAIDHCYQIATSTDETVCAECKAEHMRLCGWLGELKRRITAEQALKEREKNA